MSVMNRTLLTSTAALGIAFALTMPTTGQIRVGTQTVPIYVTVIDAAKRLVPDLVRDDFEVYDNGKLQTLTNFDNQATPITVVVMLDTSGSMTLSIDMVKLAAEEFLLRLLPMDQREGRRVQRQARGEAGARPALQQQSRSVDSGISAISTSAIRRGCTTRSTTASRSSKAPRPARWCSCSPTARTPRARSTPAT